MGRAGDARRPGRQRPPRDASPIDFALASAAHPGGFPPRRLDRSADRQAYEARRIANFPASGCIWYTDGGLLQSEPLGRVLEAARAIDRDDDPSTFARLNVVFDARSERPATPDRWADPERPPSWLEGLSRALSIVPEQVLHDDLRRIAKDDRRLQRIDALVEALAPAIEDAGISALAELTAEVAAARSRDRPPPSPPAADENPSAAKRRLLRRALEEIADVVDKQPVAVAMISPPLVAKDYDEVPGLLAGRFLGDFGGFLERDLRESNYALGWGAATAWIGERLPAAGLSDELVVAMVKACNEAGPESWDEVNRGGTGLADLGWRTRARLWRPAARVARNLLVEIRG